MNDFVARFLGFKYLYSTVIPGIAQPNRGNWDLYPIREAAPRRPRFIYRRQVFSLIIINMTVSMFFLKSQESKSTSSGTR
jgi:hypothetical protein